MKYIQIARAYHGLVSKRDMPVAAIGIVCNDLIPTCYILMTDVFLMLHEYMEDMIIMKRALQ